MTDVKPSKRALNTTWSKSPDELKSVFSASMGCRVHTPPSLETIDKGIQTILYRLQQLEEKMNHQLQKLNSKQAILALYAEMAELGLDPSEFGMAENLTLLDTEEVVSPLRGLCLGNSSGLTWTGIHTKYARRVNKMRSGARRSTL